MHDKRVHAPSEREAYTSDQTSPRGTRVVAILSILSADDADADELESEDSFLENLLMGRNPLLATLFIPVKPHYRYGPLSFDV